MPTALDDAKRAWVEAVVVLLREGPGAAHDRMMQRLRLAVVALPHEDRAPFQHWCEDVRESLECVVVGFAPGAVVG